MRELTRCLKAAAILLLLLTVPAAAVLAGPDSGPAVHPERPRFVVDAPVYLGPGGEPQLRVQVVVPYPELLFEKQPDGHLSARVELVIIVYEGKDQIGGDLWTHDVTAATAQATLDPAGAFSKEERFTVPSGKIRVKVSVKDVASGQEGEMERKLEIPDFDKIPLSMSDLRFGSCAPGQADGAFEPAYVRARFGGDPLPPICVAGEIYDRGRGAGTEEYRIAWRVRDAGGRDKAADTLLVEADSSRAAFAIRPELSALTLGRYEFSAELHHRGSTVLRKINFEMDESRLSLTAGFDELIEMAGYIGTSSEISKLERSEPSEREALWAEFWNRRDPSPGTPQNEAKEEFFRRVQHANETFASADMPGWRTDRGIVYIRNGAPDQIESRPVNAAEPPYEIWHYFALNRIFIFADLDGFGRYTLVNTTRGGRG